MTYQQQQTQAIHEAVSAISDVASNLFAIKEAVESMAEDIEANSISVPPYFITVDMEERAVSITTEYPGPHAISVNGGYKDALMRAVMACLANRWDDATIDGVPLDVVRRWEVTS